MINNCVIGHVCTTARAEHVGSLKACPHYEHWLNAVSVQTESNPDRTGLFASACTYSKKQLIRV